MPVFLIRHVHAGTKARWKGNDADRPASERGVAQAIALADALAGAGVGRIVSSPTARCIQTVEPLAERLGLRLRTRKLLAPDSDPEAVIAYLIDHSDEHPVLSTHGEIIPKVLGRLAQRGMRIKSPLVAAKASTWVLEVDGARVVRGRYVPPPRTPA